MTKTVCAEIEHDLARRPDLADSVRLPRHVYQVTRRHLIADRERGAHEVDMSTAVRTSRGDAAMAVALHRLTDTEFEAFALRAIVGLSVAAASALLGIRVATLRQLQHSALRTLRYN